MKYLVTLLLLGGCCTPPPPRVEIQYVNVPVVISCVAEIPQRPTKGARPVTQDDANKWGLTSGLAWQKYADGVDAAVAGCK